MLLRRRLLLLFVAVVVGVLVLGTLTVVLLRERDDAQQRERELSVSTERVAQLGTAYADQETGERGFVITGETTFLEPYDTGRSNADDLVARLRASRLSPEGRRELRHVTTA